MNLLKNKECLNDLLNRAIAEISKLGFAKGVDEGMGWTSMQFWKIAQLLATNDEVSRDHVSDHVDCF